MAYDETKPAGADTLQDSDDYIRNNFAQIVANITNQHVWSDDTAANVVHYRVCGLIERALDGANGPVDSASLGFDPTLVLFDYIFLDTGVVLHSGSGYSDGTNHGTTYSYITAGIELINKSASYCILCLDSGASNTQAATCAMGTDKFTLTWAKTGSPAAKTIQIRYTAFG